MKKISTKIISLLILLSIVFGATGCVSDTLTDTTSTSSTTAVSTTETTVESKSTTAKSTTSKKTTAKKPTTKASTFSLKNIPKFKNDPYVVINNNKPYFAKSDYTKKSYEKYSSLDYLGRCGVCIANIGKDIMPTEKRGAIGSVKPTGWHTVKYSGVDGKYLYNRCHLIGYQLSGENANEQNLITGTRYLNVDGMLPFENMVADYVKETENHVLYRVTPIFSGDELVARGVLMEAYSIEDNGDGICFNVYCYNNQPNVKIDYKTGESTGPSISDTTKKKTTAKSSNSNTKGSYILNTNTKKFHNPNCSSANRIKDSNKKSFRGKRSELIDQGYSPCKNCNP